MYNIFENLMFVETLTSEDEYFRRGTCNNIEKRCWQIIGVICITISYLVANNLITPIENTLVTLMIH